MSMVGWERLSWERLSTVRVYLIWGVAIRRVGDLLLRVEIGLEKEGLTLTLTLTDWIRKRNRSNV